MAGRCAADGDERTSGAAATGGARSTAGEGGAAAVPAVTAKVWLVGGGGSAEGFGAVAEGATAVGGSAG